MQPPQAGVTAAWQHAGDAAAPPCLCSSTTCACLALPCTALHCLALPCTALHCLALPCTALHCLALPCTALHCLAAHDVLSTSSPASHLPRQKPLTLMLSAHSSGKVLIWPNTNTKMVAPQFLPLANTCDYAMLAHTLCGPA
jgi:hypothetical protein